MGDLKGVKPPLCIERNKVRDRIKLKLKTLRFQRGVTPLCYGFTIVELAVIITFVAILLSIAVIIGGKVVKKEHVEDETARIVSLIKEAQKYSMIDNYYKESENSPVQKRHYGVKFLKSEDFYTVSMVRKPINTNEGDIKEEVVKTYNLKNIHLYMVTRRNNNEQVEDFTKEYVYFNDIGATNDNKTIRVSDSADNYKKNVVISQMGNVNIEKPEE